MRKVPFLKASACGNDFLIVEGSKVLHERARFTREICDRHYGVGADGVEWIVPSSVADLTIHLINADGSEAEISGNGTRCVAAHWIAERGGTEVAIETGAGVKRCKLVRRADPVFEFETGMGAPLVEEAFALETARGTFQGVPVSTGNPHFVIFVDRFQDGWQVDAESIQKSGLFKQGINIEFARVVSPNQIEIRIFERGAGETMSSGTGSCVSAVAAIATGRSRSPVQVQSPGGTQTVRWENNEVYLQGPARIICKGEFLTEIDD